MALLALGAGLLHVREAVAMAAGTVVVAVGAHADAQLAFAVVAMVGAQVDLVFEMAGLAVLALDELAAGLLGFDLALEIGSVDDEQTLHSVLHSTLRVDDLRAIAARSVLTIPANLEIVNRF